MKKILLMGIICQCLCIILPAQSLRDNLQKYWYYRNRLLNNFVKVSTSADNAATEAGTNIPVSEINTADDYLKMDDGNGALNQYISVLATEYKLLKSYGQDYSQTTQLLYYALTSLNRLDATAESYYRQGVTNAGDLNGFIVRNDVTQPFWDKYRKGGTTQYFPVSKIKISDNNPQPPLISQTNPYGNNYEMSEDNVIHYLEALSLVNALVDNETVDGTVINFKQIAKDIAQRMVSFLNPSSPYTCNYCLDKDNEHYCLPVKYSWYVKNPVTGNLVPQGDGTDGSQLILSDGYAASGNSLLGTSTFQGMGTNLMQDLLQIPITDLQVNLTLKIMACIPVPLANDPIDPKLQLNLHGASFDRTVYELNFGSDSWSSLCKNIVSTNLKTLCTIKEDDYKVRSLSATGNIGANGQNTYHWLSLKQHQNNVWKYEHLPLIWSVLNNDFSNITQTDVDSILILLNSAPACGPYFFSDNDNGGDWSSCTRLVWPEDNRKDEPHREFNGLDYMLLHNLYWLTYRHNSPPNYLYLQPRYLPQTSSLNLTASTAIICSDPITLSGNSMGLNAGSYVELDPGFQINQGPFNIDIAEVTTKSEMLYFRKIDLTNYNANTCPDKLK